MTIAYVQGKLGPDSGGSAVNSQTITLNSAVTTGNMIAGVFNFYNSNGSTTLTITDDKSNSYSVATQVVSSFSPAEIMNFFYCLNITNSPTVITATLGGGATAQFFVGIADEFSGVATSSALDQATGQNLSGAVGTDSITSGAATTGANGELIYGSYVTFAAVSVTAGTGFTLTEQATPGVASDTGSEYLIQSSAGSIAATFTPAAVTNALAGMMTLKAAVSSAWTPVNKIQRNWLTRRGLG